MTVKRCVRLVLLVLLCLNGRCALSAQSAPSAPPYPAHLPYSFNNFVWWSDEELRALLKKRIPGLGDEIATTSAAEGRVREALKALLREKGIVAEVQSQEPSFSSFRPPMENVLGVHVDEDELPPFHPTIVFSLAQPHVIVGKIGVQSDVPDMASSIQREFNIEEETSLSQGSLSFSCFRVERLMKQKGHLGAKAVLQYGAPYKSGDSYATDVTLAVTAGPLYRISSLAVDGGVLFEGKDLGELVGAKVGDTASDSPFRGIRPQLENYYRQLGYADVALKTSHVLDAEHATVAYTLTVIPGLIYHLRSLTVPKLSPQQEGRVRDLLAMKLGDLYREAAITDLYRKIASEPLLKGYGFGYSAKPDKATGMVDLSLDFSREGGTATVTVK